MKKLADKLKDDPLFAKLQSLENQCAEEIVESKAVIQSKYYILKEQLKNMCDHRFMDGTDALVGQKFTRRKGHPVCLICGRQVDKTGSVLAS